MYLDTMVLIVIHVVMNYSMLLESSVLLIMSCATTAGETVRCSGTNG